MDSNVSDSEAFARVGWRFYIQVSPEPRAATGPRVDRLIVDTTGGLDPADIVPPIPAIQEVLHPSNAPRDFADFDPRGYVGRFDGWHEVRITNVLEYLDKAIQARFAIEKRMYRGSLPPLAPNVSLWSPRTETFV